MGRVIKLTESDLYRIVKRVISEQKTTNSGTLTDQQAVISLEKEINKIISEKQNEIFSSLTLKWKSGGDDKPVILSVLFDGKDSGKDIVMNYESDRRQWVTEVAYIDMGDNPISEYLGPVYENPDYKILFERHPYIKEQVDAAMASCFMVPQNRQFGYVSIVGGLSNGKDGYGINEQIPFGSGLTTDGQGSNLFSIQVGKKIMFNFEVGNSKLYLKAFKIGNTGPIFKQPVYTGDTTTERVVSITLDNKNAEPFIFDTIQLQQDSIDSINMFVSQIKEVSSTYGEDMYNKYINFLKQNPITVLAYSSIDGDPKQKVQGKYGPCRGYGDGTRGQYNLCLSQGRADEIAKILNEKLPEIGNFVGKGMGETDEFDPGKKWPNSKSTDETLKNRRFMVKLPTFKLDNIKVEK